MYPATKSQPKEMLPLGTKPTIQLVAEELAGADLRQILIVTGRQKRAIEDHFDPGDGLDPDHKCPRCAELFDTTRVQFFYTRQSSPRGLGDAVFHAHEFTGGDPFVVALGDCVIAGPGRASLLRRMLEAHEANGAAATIAVQTVPLEATSRYGIVAPAGEAQGTAFRLADIVEKPGPERAPSNLAVCARYVFGPAIFEHLAATAPGHGGELQLTDAIRSLIAAGQPVYAVPLVAGEVRLDVGDFGSYSRAFMRTMLTHPDLGPSLQQYARGLLEELAAGAGAGAEAEDEKVSPGAAANQGCEGQ
jgi:UTP--glucose-1-phosphate uridylyltransferase